jgi:hypothetical protein
LDGELRFIVRRIVVHNGHRLAVATISLDGRGIIIVGAAHRQRSLA